MSVPSLPLTTPRRAYSPPSPTVPSIVLTVCPQRKSLFATFSVFLHHPTFRSDFAILNNQRPRRRRKRHPPHCSSSVCHTFPCFYPVRSRSRIILWVERLGWAYPHYAQQRQQSRLPFAPHLLTSPNVSSLFSCLSCSSAPPFDFLGIQRPGHSI